MKDRDSIHNKGRNILVTSASVPAMGPAQTLCPVDIGAVSPVVKRPSRVDDYSPSQSAEVQNSWSYTSAYP
jgi:hypothetical protein